MLHDALQGKQRNMKGQKSKDDILRESPLTCEQDPLAETGTFKQDRAH